jgi:hypothetical protein
MAYRSNSSQKKADLTPFSPEGGSAIGGAALNLGRDMNRVERPQLELNEAHIQYLDGDFRILRPGSFVRCAVTHQSIALDELRYWSVDLQEAYASPQEKLTRMGAKLKK